MKTKMKTTLPDGEWLVSGGLLYRLKDGVNCDEINVTMAAGVRDDAVRQAVAVRLQGLMAALSQPIVSAVVASDALANLARYAESCGEGGGVYPDQSGDYVKLSDVRAALATASSAAIPAPVYAPPKEWRDVIAEARDSICAGGFAENKQHERSIVEPYLDGIYDELEALESDASAQAAAIPAAGAAWQPIETAPKDCGFLGYQAVGELWVIAPMYWCGTEFLLVGFHSDNTEHAMQPTHWMPIPAAPSTPKEPA